MNRLFEEIVARICSTQDLQVAFYDLQKLLKAHSRIEGVFLGHHAPDSQELYHLAYADSRSSHNLNYTIRADDELQAYLLSKQRREVNVFPTLGDFPAMARTLAPHIPERHALYELRVRLDGRHIGMLAFHAPEPALSNEMLELLLKIRGPIALTLANRLRALSAWPKPLAGHPSANRRTGFFHIPGSSAAMCPVYRALELAAPTENTVLFVGETGVGKEVYARHLHALSLKCGKAFVHVNCGGIAEALIDSELFGHKKGAFTGASTDHAGFFEQANGGAIFLDEIGELPLQVQARLLLVLQNKTIRRVGGTRTIPLDIRIMAATNCNIEKMCREGRFRKDLYYRLNCVQVEIPPLRARKEDIPALAEQFLKKTVLETGEVRVPRIPPAEMTKMLQYEWPGNVRELENCIRRSVMWSEGKELWVDIPTEKDMERWSGSDADTSASGKGRTFSAFAPPRIAHLYNGAGLSAFSPKSLPGSLDEQTRAYIEMALRQAGGRIHGEGGAADILGVNPSTLRSRMQKLGIPFGRNPR